MTMSLPVYAWRHKILESFENSDPLSLTELFDEKGWSRRFLTNSSKSLFIGAIAMGLLADFLLYAVGPDFLSIQYDSMFPSVHINFSWKIPEDTCPCQFSTLHWLAGQVSVSSSLCAAGLVLLGRTTLCRSSERLSDLSGSVWLIYSCLLVVFCGLQLLAVWTRYSSGCTNKRRLLAQVFLAGLLALFFAWGILYANADDNALQKQWLTVIVFVILVPLVCAVALPLTLISSLLSESSL
jgi:hypothetical protein